jgi:hypothetical protein
MKKLLVALGIVALSTGAMAQNVGGSIIYNSDNGHYYQMFLNSQSYQGSWQEAQDFAVSQNGNLVSITSQSEQSFIETNFSNYSSNVMLGLLTGGHKVNGTWTWSDGSAWNYTKWWPGQPDGWGGQDVMHYQGHSGNQYIGATYWDDYWGNKSDAMANTGIYGYSGFIIEYTSNPTSPGNNAVPEPSEWAAMGLLASGLLGLVVRGGKKNLEAAK